MFLLVVFATAVVLTANAANDEAKKKIVWKEFDKSGMRCIDNSVHNRYIGGINDPDRCKEICVRRGVKYCQWNYVWPACRLANHCSRRHFYRKNRFIIWKKEEVEVKEEKCEKERVWKEFDKSGKRCIDFSVPRRYIGGIRDPEKCKRICDKRGVKYCQWNYVWPACRLANYCSRRHFYRKNRFIIWERGMQCKKPKDECKGVADVGFVIDSSGSLGSHYQDEKDFLKSLTRAFGVSKAGSHAGVVTFSLKAELSIKFNQYTTQQSFDTAVDNIRLFNGFTRIDRGLRIAKNELFSVKNGARASVSKLLVLITDGSQTEMPGSENPADIAAKIREAGIKMIAVGIGSAVKPAELARIAGNKKDVYTAANFDELKKPAFASKVKKAMCPK